MVESSTEPSTSSFAPCFSESLRRSSGTLSIPDEAPARCLGPSPSPSAHGAPQGASPTRVPHRILCAPRPGGRLAPPRTGVCPGPVPAEPGPHRRSILTEYSSRPSGTSSTFEVSRLSPRCCPTREQRSERRGLWHPPRARVREGPRLFESSTSAAVAARSPSVAADPLAEALAVPRRVARPRAVLSSAHPGRPVEEQLPQKDADHHQGTPRAPARAADGRPARGGALTRSGASSRATRRVPRPRHSRAASSSSTSSPTRPWRR